LVTGGLGGFARDTSSAMGWANES